MTHENYVSVKLDCIEPYWLIYVDLSGYDSSEGSQSLKHLLSSPLQKSLLTPGGSVGKEFTRNVGDIEDSGSVHGSRRSPGGGHGNPLQWAGGSLGQEEFGGSQSQIWLKCLSMHANIVGKFWKLKYIYIWGVIIWRLWSSKSCGYESLGTHCVLPNLSRT